MMEFKQPLLTAPFAEEEYFNLLGTIGKRGMNTQNKQQQKGKINHAQIAKKV